MPKNNSGSSRSHSSSSFQSALGRVPAGGSSIADYTRQSNSAERFWVTGQPSGRSGSTMARDLAAWDARWTAGGRPS
ncbi:hypothetical protein DL766_010609 [Monosporascus sp. MC13-8B]|uniref:Uncharacterized protein n=1 Tax=Monosporascus cannonballus TaxID=155416 RepID=A0ABY0H735_9PEZI|nr:hypothetical protein DL762_006150 [Monosporascus cannonballus]RYO90957.1 hypothetical protein DL763_005128 [Monosporascus cannonballus]RYP01968.1 hypothetical protein DL766_010609 [Monosporascus sp. MC13-8B]